MTRNGRAGVSTLFLPGEHQPHLRRSGAFTTQIRAHQLPTNASWAIGQPKQNTCPVREHRETWANIDPGGTRTNANWSRSHVPVVFENLTVELLRRARRLEGLEENSTLQRITSNLERRRGDSNEVLPFSAIFVDIPDAICATESKTRRILCSWRAARAGLSRRSAFVQSTHRAVPETGSRRTTISTAFGSAGTDGLRWSCAAQRVAFLCCCTRRSDTPTHSRTPPDWFGYRAPNASCACEGAAGGFAMSAYVFCLWPDI